MPHNFLRPIIRVDTVASDVFRNKNMNTEKIENFEKQFFLKIDGTVAFLAALSACTGH